MTSKGKSDDKAADATGKPSDTPAAKPASLVPDPAVAADSASATKPAGGKAGDGAGKDARPSPGVAAADETPPRAPSPKPAPAKSAPPPATEPVGPAKAAADAVKTDAPVATKAAASAPVAPAKPEPAPAPAPAKPPAAVAKAATAAAKPEPAPAPALVAADTRPAPATAAPKPATPPAPRPLPPLSMDVLAPAHDVDAILSADHRDPFGFLGMHRVEPGPRLVIRTLQPGATAVSVIDPGTGGTVAELRKVRDEGFFVGSIDDRSAPFAYRFRVETDGLRLEVDDPYRFPPILSEQDAHLLAEGNHFKSYEKLGAHPATIEGIAGVTFAVWAPHASRVAVIGSFNGWDGRRHGMRLRHDCGVWEIFLPGVKADDLYKYEIKSATGQRLADKCDPYAFAVEPSPGSAAVVSDPGRYRWGDGAWMAKRRTLNPREIPISIFGMHLPSWRRKPEEGHRPLTYRELAEFIPSYVKDMGFTHVEFLPVSEFDFEASLGFQPFALYAPTSRWGSPDEFRLLVDRCHQEGIGVILDWVPNHFTDDPHGLRTFDGTHLYEHPDSQRRHHPGGSALVYDYGRREVANYLISNGLYWLDRFHIDALRVGSLATMLYLDYRRNRGEWTPNRFGGHENLEGVDFLRRFNEKAYADQPGVFTVAEDTSAWARVSHPTFLGGLGFGFRWNSVWTRDTLRYLSRNPVHRKYYHDELTAGPGAAFQENFILPLSHDDVAFGKGSLIRRMPGDRWQKFANLRTYYTLMYTHPGKKLMFMGNEFAQDREWNSDISLDWHLLGDDQHLGIQTLVRDLNALYRSSTAMHQLDCEADGFEWIDCNDSDQSVIAFLRKSRDGRGTIIAVCNFTPVIRNHYRVGVPEPGFYRERLNTDAQAYGGGNVGNEGGVMATEEGMHGRPYGVTLRLPPFAAVILEHEGRQTT
jgi:1,4-alpha-glucan branching enzyme